MTKARRRGPSMCFSTARVMGLAKPIWNSFFPAGPLLDMSRPSGRVDSIRHKGEEVATGYWGEEGGGVWGHEVIFAGDRRLKAKGRGGSHGAGSVWLRVVQKTFCFRCSHLLGWPTLPCPPPEFPPVWPVPPSLPKFPMALTASSNSPWEDPTQAEATWQCWCCSLECQGP